MDRSSTAWNQTSYVSDVKLNITVKVRVRLEKITLELSKYLMVMLL